MPLFRIFVLALGVMVGALSAHAQNVLVRPQLFDVTRVASNDVLNVRQLPSVSGEIVGALAHNNLSVEVIALSPDRKWGLVNIDDRSGWVAMRFMQPSPISHEPPTGLDCSGTEPFWSLIFDPSNIGQADWSMMGLTDGESLYDGYWSVRPSNRATQSFAFRLPSDVTGSGVSASGIIRTEICSDGMSDRNYGYSIDVILIGDQPMYIAGCCSIRP